MRSGIPAPAVFLLITSLVGLASATAQGSPTPYATWPGLRDAGVPITGDRVTENNGMAPRGGTMLGMSRAFPGAGTRGFDHLRLALARTTLVYTAHASGQGETSFTATASRTPRSPSRIPPTTSPSGSPAGA